MTLLRRANLFLLLKNDVNTITILYLIMHIFTKFSWKTLLPTVAMLFVAGMALGQRTVTGTVQDQETGEFLIGVTIIEKENRSNGAVTDLDGRFSIRVSDKASNLLVNYTGYQEQEVPITGDNLDIKITTNTLLKEVIVIGYGTVKREDATGLVQAVSSSQFNRGAITGPQELLAGKIAGVAITTDGSPGGGSRIRIRGESSLSASNDPLIVIDGVPLASGDVSGGRNPLNLINPNDIETMTVLKDASAAAIYGNRASGGVIIITTKKGALGKKINIGYNVNLSLGETFNRIDVLNGDEMRAAIAANYAADHPSQALLGTANTDWQNEIFQQAFAQDHNLSVSGGVGMVPYRVSLGYTNKDGLLRTDNFNRYTGAVNLSPKFLDNRLQFNLNFKGMLSKNHFADRGALGAALSFDPTRPVRDTSMGRYGGYSTWVIANGNPNGLAPANPLALLELRDDNSTVQHIVTSAAADYRFKRIPELRYNLNVAYDHSYGKGTTVVPDFAAFSFDKINGGGTNNRYNQTRINSLLETYLNYKKEVGQHGVEVMGGYSWQRQWDDATTWNSNIAGSEARKDTIINGSEIYLLSFFGRVNYTFRNRYLLTLNYRRDATSRFAPEYRWGNFPGVAAAVKIRDNDRRYLNHLKVRASFGVTGQQETNNRYQYQALYQQSNNTAQYQLGDSLYNILRANGYDYNSKWEENASYNAGLDFSIVRDRVGGSLDFYTKTSTDLLVFIAQPALSNLTNFLIDNIGSMRSRGIELTLNLTPVATRKVRWDFSGNIAYNQNKITKITNRADSENFIGIKTGGISGGVGSTIQLHTEGFAPSTFHVYEQLYDESGNILEGQYADRDGNGVVNDLDKYRHKQPSPVYSLGFTSNLNVGSFDFSFAGRSYLGGYIYNNVQTDMGYLDRLYHPTKYLVNVNQSAVDLNVKAQSSLTFSDHFVENANFLRIDHVTAGYNFQKLVGKNLRLYGTIQNPLLFTQYKGLDPEVAGGIDNSTYPRARTYLLGLSVNF